jgi:uncharacterized membrane protein
MFKNPSPLQSVLESIIIIAITITIGLNLPLSIEYPIIAIAIISTIAIVLSKQSNRYHYAYALFMIATTASRLPIISSQDTSAVFIIFILIFAVIGTLNYISYRQKQNAEW